MSLFSITISALLIANMGPETVSADKDPAITFGESANVPQGVLGSWKLVREECEEEGEPKAKIPEAIILFREDLRYEFFIEGWTFMGHYKVEKLRDPPLRIQLKDSMQNFDFKNGRLENWSEGDAVYLCGNIFERTE